MILSEATLKLIELELFIHELLILCPHLLKCRRGRG